MEKVILVDHDDNKVGEMDKMEAHKKALLHRAVSVFIFNSDKQLLIQRRASSKYHSAGLWSNTACTHPYPNEKNLDAAIRRLKEEMGIEVLDLKKAFHFIYKEKLSDGLTEFEFDHIFIGYSDTKPNPESTEVSDYKYVTTDDILDEINHSPEKYTIWFRKMIQQVLDYVEHSNPK